MYICVIVQFVFPAPEISGYQNWRAFGFVYNLCSNVFYYLPLSNTKSKKQSKQKPIFRLFLVLQSRWAFKQSKVLHVANCFRYESFLWYCWLLKFIVNRFYSSKESLKTVIPIQSYSEIIFNSSFLSHRARVVSNNNNINNVLFNGTFFVIKSIVKLLWVW